MKVLIEIPDNEAVFGLKVLKSLYFVKNAKPISSSAIGLWEDLKLAASTTCGLVLTSNCAALR